MDAEPRWFEGRLRPGTLQRLLHVVFVICAVALALSWAKAALPRYLPKDWSKAHEYDALQDWLGARMYVTGESPYTKHGLSKLHTVAFGHPPTAPFLLIPMARFDKALAAEMMDLALWLLLAIHLYVCARAVKFPSPAALTVLLFGWALTTEGLVNHWHAIQSSEYIAAGIVFCWIYLRRGRQVPAGIALGLAATFKLFPGVLFLLLLVARRFRAFAAASLTYLGIAAFMSATYGFDAWKLFLTQQGPVADVWVGSVRNASLHGIVVRLLTPVCQGDPHPSAKANYIAAGAALTLLVLSSLLSLKALKRAREQDPRAIDVPYALFTVLSVFINPWVWEHYWVLLIQPAFVVASGLYGPLRDAFRGWLDESTSSRALVSNAAAFGFGAACIGATAKLIGSQDVRTERLLDLWRSTKSDWSHRQMHLYEVFNCLPWIIMLVACMFVVRRATQAPPQRPVR